MLPVIAIRPLAGASTAADGDPAPAIDLAVEAFPLAEVRPLPWSAPDPDAVDALLVGSANAFRHGGDALDRFRDKPVFAVGPATARAAERRGFTVRLAGAGGLQALLGLIEQRPVRLLWLAGARRLPLKSPPGVSVTTRVVYTLDYLQMPPAMADLLRAGALVLLHSAGAAEHLLAECDRLGIDRAKVRLAALGPRIAEAAGTGWGAVRSAERPAEAALLALAADMCQ